VPHATQSLDLDTKCPPPHEGKAGKAAKTASINANKQSLDGAIPQVTLPENAWHFQLNRLQSNSTPTTAQPSRASLFDLAYEIW